VDRLPVEDETGAQRRALVCKSCEQEMITQAPITARSDDETPEFAKLLNYVLKHDPVRGMELVLKAMDQFPDRGDAPVPDLDAIADDHLREELRNNQWVRFLLLTRKKGVSNRRIAKFCGMSEATIRREFATFDALTRKIPKEINGGYPAAASNVASPALAAVLRNLPKLTPAEREIVSQEIDIQQMPRNPAASGTEPGRDHGTE
jgi:hypothetical protein